MEVERAPAAGAIHGLQQPPRVTGAMGGGRSAGTSSLLSAAVQEMLMVQKSNKAIKKPPRATLRLPPVISGGRSREGQWTGAGDRAPDEGVVSVVATVAAASDEEGRQEHAEAERPAAGRREEEDPDLLLRASPAGATLRAAPVRTWTVLDAVAVRAGEAVAPRACGRGRWMFSEYARWRRSVWMPSRFYLERVDRQPHEPAIVLDAGRR